MEDDPRSFQSVNIGFIGAETGRERFTRDDHYSPPVICQWRNNLTALSQRYNLYFAASRENILVYQPDFPFQTLGRTAQLLIPSAVANPEARGYIDGTHPHAVNHLLVADLGDEEVILVVTDSGNITGYYTKTIEAATHKTPHAFSADGRSDLVGVRPFFAQWVHESAWGLAVHSRGRMIAVSANTIHHVQMDDPSAKITVFAFALAQCSGEHSQEVGISLNADENQGSDWHEWQPNLASTCVPPRNMNYKITLGGGYGHSHNIPNICFVNTDQDIEGRWLLSTDIGGEMKFWDIWRGYCYRTWDFAERNPFARWRQRTEQGWNVAALDPSAFRFAGDMTHYCGHAQAPRYADATTRNSYDITHIVRIRTPGNSAAHPLHGHFDEEELRADSDTWSDPDASDHEDSQRNEVHAGERMIEDISRNVNPQETFPSPDTDLTGPETTQPFIVADELETGSVSVNSDLGSGTSDVSGSGDALAVVQRSSLVAMEVDTDEHDHSDDVEGNSESEGAELDHSSTSQHSDSSIWSLAARAGEDHEADTFSNLPQYDVSSVLGAFPSQLFNPKFESAHSEESELPESTTSLPRMPILHCSASHLRLLDSPEAKTPHLFCANILKQTFPPELQGARLTHMDRLNMIHQIPELGIVIVASQIGRVAICTTTKYAKNGSYGLRVDWVLPTRRQEANQLRPVMPLLGVAVSPIQGRLKSGQSTNGEPELEDDQETVPAWGQDGVDGGVVTTFDPSMIVLEGSRDGSVSRPDDESCASTISSSGPQAKRKRVSYCSSTARTSHKETRKPKWEVPQPLENWQSVESSRRYRLMLTYLDLTVLTYELSRGVEREDVLKGEASSLDFVD